jgi:hypothetical protein
LISGSGFRVEDIATDIDDFATDAIAARVGAMDVNGKTERSGVFS